MDFCPNFPKLARNVLCAFCPQIFPHKDHLNLFGVTSKKGLFCKRWAPFFEGKQRWVPFLPRFSGIPPEFSEVLPKFSTNQHFWGCACNPASFTTATEGAEVVGYCGDSYWFRVNLVVAGAQVGLPTKRPDVLKLPSQARQLKGSHHFVR